MLKRGQVTAFVVVSLVVLLGVGLVIYSQWDYLEDNIFSAIFNNVPEEVQPVHSHVMNCIEETAEVIVPWVSWQGGYYRLGDNLNSENFTLYVDRGKRMLPSVSFIEGQMSEGMEKNLEYCIDFDLLGYEVEGGEVIVQTEIQEEKLVFEVNYDGYTLWSCFCGH
jgi:hypothetical protein